MSTQALSLLDEAGIAAAAGAIRRAFTEASTLEELKSARLVHSGDTASITQTNALIKGLDKTDRPVASRLMDVARKRIQAVLAEATAKLEAEEAAAALEREKVDVAVPTRRNLRGARHLLTMLIEDVADFFIGMGWEIAEGPEVKREWFNFDVLNFGPDHPACRTQDTFYISDIQTVESTAADVVGAPGAGAADRTGDVGAQPGLILCTHASPVQGCEMFERDAPLYIACPGKVFRTDALDATRTPVFHQVGDLAVDKGLTMAHLKGALDHSARAMFGPGAKTRLRPSSFPLTGPNAEMNLWFPQKEGGADWIEQGGCGMVSPEVLRNVGTDPDEYTGFAFGMGLERTLMFHHGITDMRDMVEGDVHFSLQFGATGGGS